MYESSPLPYNTLAKGIVVDTNDPQGSRIRVYCQDYGDMPETPIEYLPWCQVVQLFSGLINSDQMSRGPSDEHKSKGGISYGTHFLPKVGSEVIISCINGDPNQRIMLGSLPPINAEHTMPHGRYLDNDGPFTSEEQPIEPLYSNLKKAFGDDPNKPEFISRATDYSINGLPQHIIDNELVPSKKRDQKSGYKKSRLQSNLENPDTQHTYESQIFSITTPGFHSFSMDDSEDNCRMRFRTSAGHNIILDDTNERIYINTAQGNNWIEIDQDGTIDIYATKTISINSDEDINIHSKKDIKMNAENIHLYASNNINLKSDKDTNIDAENIVKSASEKYSLKCKKGDVSAKKSLSMKGDSTTIKGGKSMNVSAPKTDIKGSGMLNMSGAVTSLKGQGMLNMSGGVTNLSGSSTVMMGAPAMFASQGIADSFGYITSNIMGNVINTLNNLPMNVLGQLQGLAGFNIDQLSNMVGGQLADFMGSMDGMLGTLPDIGGMLDGLPLDNLTDMMGTLDISNLMGQLPISDLSNIMGQLPDMSSMLGQLPDIGGILNDLPDVSNLLGSLPNVDNLLGSLPLNDLSNIMGSLPTDGLMNVLNNVGDIGNIMNMVPNITNNLSSEMLGGLLENLPIDDLSNIMETLPNVSSILPNMNGNALNNIMMNLDNDIASNILSEVSSNMIGGVLYNLPTSKINELLPMLPVEHQMNAIKSLPKNYINGFDDIKSETRNFNVSRIVNKFDLDIPSSMSANDFGEVLKGLPNSKISEIVEYDLDFSNEIFSEMNGSLSGNIFKGVEESLVKMPNVGGLLNKIPMIDIKGMLENKKDLLSLIPSDAFGGLMDGMNGVDFGEILKGSGDINSIISNMGINDFGKMLEGLPEVNMNGILDNIKIDNLSSMMGDLPLDDFGGVLDKIPNGKMMEIMNNVGLEKSGEMLSKMSPEKVNEILSEAGEGEPVPSKPKKAAYPSRIPMHEPWGRTYTKSPTDKSPKHSYDDDNIGKNDGKRGKNWKR